MTKEHVSSSTSGVRAKSRCKNNFHIIVYTYSVGSNKRGVGKICKFNKRGGGEENPKINKRGPRLFEPREYIIYPEIPGPYRAELSGGT